MAMVTVDLKVTIQLEINGDMDINDVINELDYSFNSCDLEDKVNVWDYYIADYQVKENVA